MHVLSYGRTDLGCTRKNNEDAYVCDAKLELFVVCDGLGGHQAGEVASRACVDMIQQCVAENVFRKEAYLKERSVANRLALGQVLEQAVQRANLRVRQLASATPEHNGMGTTVVAVWIAGDFATIAHVGDSRAVLCRGAETQVLTRDHKVGVEMMAQGIWTAEEAKKSAFAETLSRAVGAADYAQADILQVEMLPEDTFLICTDGFHRYWDKDNELPTYVRNASKDQWAQSAVDFARNLGGADNITAVVLHVVQDKQTDVRMNLAIDAMRKGEVMGKVPLFRYLNYSDVTKLLAVASVQPFPKGAIIIQEDSVGEEMSIICSGSALVTKGGQTLAQLTKGDVFGEMSICDNAKRSASVVAAEPAVLMTLKRADLLPLFRRDSQLAVKFLWALNQDLNHRLRVASRGLADAKAALQLLAEQEQGRRPDAPV